MSSASALTLSRSAVFGSLDGTELDRLASACGMRTYGPGDIVFLRGDEGDCMYVVASGAVGVSLSSVDGRDVLLAVLGPGKSFGELALVDGGPRVATVTARTTTVLAVVPRHAVTAVMARHPSVVTELLRSMAALVRRLDEQARDASLLDLPRRVEKYLSAAARISSPDRSGDELVPVDVALNQADIARHIGGSRQQVNRVLMGLEAAGSIERLGHRIVAVRPARLFADE